MDARSRLATGLIVTLLMISACSEDPVSPPDPPAPTVDLSGYFLLPDTTWNKFFTTGSQTYVKDSSIAGASVVIVSQPDGQLDYFQAVDRAWAAFDAGALFEINPPLAALPDAMPESSDHVASANILTGSGNAPIRRISRLVDTALTLTVGPMTFDSVVLIRQEFWLISVPVNEVDSAYRWYAHGVDEIRSVRWRHGQTDSTVRIFTRGTIGGRPYP